MSQPLDPHAADVFGICPMSDDLMGRLADALGEFDPRAIQMRVLIALPGDTQPMSRGAVHGIAAHLSRSGRPDVAPLIDEITAALRASRGEGG